MIIARRKVTFQPERYEGIEIEFTATYPDDTDPDDISRHLDELMAPEVHRAREVATSLGKDDTSVHAWQSLIEQTTEGA